MDFDTVVKKRKSVRSFSKRRAGWRAVLDAIDAALQGPFANNHNNLYFVIVEDPATIKTLANHCEQAWIAQASILVVVCSDDTHLERMYGERGRVYSRQQSGAAIGTFLLKIADLGLSSCWVGSYSDELIKTTLSIPQHIQIEAVLPVGYERRELGKTKKPEKRELDGKTYWDAWDRWGRGKLFQEDRNDNRITGQMLDTDE